MVTQDELEQLVLNAFYDHAQKGDQKLYVSEVFDLLNGQFGRQRVELAVRALANRELLDGSYSMNRPSSYSISQAGYRLVEQTYLERLTATEAAQAASDPLLLLDQQLAPASSRMVSFGDNQDDYEQAISSVSDAEEVLRASNSLDPIIRDETLASLSAWKSLISAGKRFAVGAFNYLVWDRLKAVMEGGIEDTYRFVIAGILMALGSLIVGLL